jgi:glyoxylase-like metal-dependent hydrolase (beta-lactamase superfamily II)
VSPRIEKVVTSGTFSLDGGTWDVDNNVWLVGDDSECVIIDAAHDAGAIADAVGTRHVVAVLLTHAHDDHIDAVADLVPRHRRPDGAAPGRLDALGAPLPRSDAGPPAGAGRRRSRRRHAARGAAHPRPLPWQLLLLRPRARGGVHRDTLFAGGPGATGRSYSDFPTIVESIQSKLLTLPPETVVHTGHGDDTTIGAEAPSVQEWLDRGH